jgi:hypothetical protein
LLTTGASAAGGVQDSFDEFIQNTMQEIVGTRGARGAVLRRKRHASSLP